MERTRVQWMVCSQSGHSGLTVTLLVVMGSEREAGSAAQLNMEACHVNLKCYLRVKLVLWPQDAL